MRYKLLGIVTDEQIDVILADHGVRLIDDWPFAGDVMEVYSNGYIGLRAGLDYAWKRFLKAHALFHHLCHGGNQFRLSDLIRARQESQANEFASWLLLGGILVPEDAQFTVWHIAETAGVPVHFVKQWLRQTVLLLIAGASLGTLSIVFC